jgi:predicted nucleotidyltransferase
MAKKFDREELDLIVNDYVTKLKEKITIDKVVLYGSYAKGLATEFSDIDLMIISSELPLNKPKGANGFYLDQLVGLESINPSLEVIGVNPKNLLNPVSKSFFDEVLRTGIDVII